MSEMMTFTLEAAELTASIEERTISGKIVPMGTGEVGNTSAGAVIFERDSIEIPEPKSIRLLAQHDIKQPLGRAQSFEKRDDGVYAVFSLSRSSKATDYLLMAQEGLVTGLSVGVEVKSSKPSRDGVDVLTSLKVSQTMDAADNKGNQLGVVLNMTNIKLTGYNNF